MLHRWNGSQQCCVNCRTVGGVETPLAQADLPRWLTDAPSASPRQALALARERVLAGRKLDMSALADELGVSRTTLFRWVGGRSDLLVEVFWSLAESAMRAAIGAASGHGGARIAAMVGHYLRAVLATPAFGAQLSREPQSTLQLLTAAGSPVQRRSIAVLAELLEQEIADGALDPPLPVPDLAYLVVRIAESFLYTPLITGEPAAPEKAEAAVAALLR